MTLVAEPNDCYFYYWIFRDDELNIDIVNDNPAYLTMDRNYSVEDVCSNQSPVPLSVTSDGCCPILVTGLLGIEGSIAVPAGESREFLCVPSADFPITLDAQEQDTCVFDLWIIDGEINYNSYNYIEIYMTTDHTATAVGSIVRQYGDHYYALVNVSINWADARDAAASRQYEGLQGHLATVTSANENLWLTNTFTGDELHLHWIGGSQPPDSTEPDGGWTWITGEPWDFSNWWTPGEPNNLNGTEDSILFDHGVLPEVGKAWNDADGTNTADGYVVEYEEYELP
jgi:hypothetical protein